MQPIGLSAVECRKALESYSIKIKKLMELVKNSATMAPANVEEARTQLANLKSCLKRDYKLRGTNEGQTRMTQVEVAIFAPAVSQAFADLHVSVNSRPTKRWFSELYGIQITIRHALAEVERWGNDL